MPSVCLRLIGSAALMVASLALQAVPASASACEDRCREEAHAVATADADRAHLACVMRGGSEQECDDLWHGTYNSTYGIVWADCMRACEESDCFCVHYGRGGSGAMSSRADGNCGGVYDTGP